MHHTDDTTIEQTAIETPDADELSDEALDRVPGRGTLSGSGAFGI